MVLLLGACGDNLPSSDLGDEVPGPGADISDNVIGSDPTVDNGPQTVVGAAKYVPQVCDARLFPQVEHDGLDVDLAVAESGNGGTAFFTVSRFGGPVHGFAIDGRGNPTVDKTGQIIRSEKFNAISASFVDDRLITAAVSDDQHVYVDMHRQDLGALYNLATTPGYLVTEASVLASGAEGGRRTMPVATANGVSTMAFDSNWMPMGNEGLARSPNVESISASGWRGEVTLSWSTDRDCHVQTLGNGEYSRNFPCTGARLGVDPKRGYGHLVFEQDGAIMMAPMTTGPSAHLGDARVLVDAGYAPRIVWDGVREWVSYLDLHGYLVVGFLEKDGHFRTQGIPGMVPLDDAYELAVLNGQVWMYGVDWKGLAGVRMCATQVQATPTRH